MGSVKDIVERLAIIDGSLKFLNTFMNEISEVPCEEGSLQDKSIDLLYDRFEEVQEGFEEEKNKLEETEVDRDSKDSGETEEAGEIEEAGDN